jgi:hypothetical protein
VIFTAVSLAFSAIRSDHSLSNTELSLSSTLSEANEISSIRNKPPLYIAYTSTPSCHSKIIERLFLISLTSSVTSVEFERHTSISSKEASRDNPSLYASSSLCNDRFFFVLIDPMKSLVSVF